MDHRLQTLTTMLYACQTCNIHAPFLCNAGLGQFYDLFREILIESNKSNSFVQASTNTKAAKPDIFKVHKRAFFCPKVVLNYGHR